MSVSSLADVLVLIVPGFLGYAVLYRHLNPGRSETEFATAVKSVLWSLPVDAIVDILWRHYNGTRPDWVSGEVILLQLTLAVSGGVVLGFLERQFNILDMAWRRLGLVDSTRPELFRYAFDFRHRDGGYVEVRMRTGVTYEGALVYYTGDPRQDVKEIGLVDANYRAPGETAFEPLVGPVYLRSDAVDAIQITRLVDGTQPDTHWDFLQQDRWRQRSHRAAAAPFTTLSLATPSADAAYPPAAVPPIRPASPTSTPR